MRAAEIVAAALVQVLARMAVWGKLRAGSFVTIALVTAVRVKARPLARPVPIAKQAFVVICPKYLNLFVGVSKHNKQLLHASRLFNFKFENSDSAGPKSSYAVFYLPCKVYPVFFISKLLY